MKRNVLKMLGLVMTVIAIVFVVVAFNHPEMSFPWGNRVTFGFYGVYVFLMIVLLVVPVKKK